MKVNQLPSFTSYTRSVHELLMSGQSMNCPTSISHF